MRSEGSICVRKRPPSGSRASSKAKLIYRASQKRPTAGERTRPRLWVDHYYGGRKGQISNGEERESTGKDSADTERARDRVLGCQIIMREEEGLVGGTGSYKLLTCRGNHESSEKGH